MQVAWSASYKASRRQRKSHIIFELTSEKNTTAGKMNDRTSLRYLHNCDDDAKMLQIYEEVLIGT